MAHSPTPRQRATTPGNRNPDELHAPLLEVGWVAVGGLEEADWRAIQIAVQETLDYVRKSFSRFHWRMPLMSRAEWGSSSYEPPIALLDFGVQERNLKHWDYTIVVTAANLQSHYQAEAFAVISRSLETTVISTSRLDPRFVDYHASEEERVSTMARRIYTLALHALGHHGGLGHENAPSNYMYPFASLTDLAEVKEFSPEQIERMAAQFGEIADRRLEENEKYQQAAPWRFYVASALLNRREIFSAVWEARPWQFPYRLSRLTTAGVSAMLVLIVTAEVWELALSQSDWLMLLLSMTAVGVATVFLILRQRLFIRRERARLSEQTVITNVSTFIIVLLGMTATFGLLFFIALTTGYAFFSPKLVEKWAPVVGEAGVRNYVCFSAFIASLAMYIGALGATFENNNYFRHITFVDEEL